MIKYLNPSIATSASFPGALHKAALFVQSKHRQQTESINGTNVTTESVWMDPSTVRDSTEACHYLAANELPLVEYNDAFQSRPIKPMV